MIDIKISHSEQVGALSVQAALLFTWSVPHADDIGLLPGSLLTLKAMIVPMWSISAAQFNAVVHEILVQKLWIPFEFMGDSFFKIPGFNNHQILKRDRQPQTLLKIKHNKDPLKTWEAMAEIGFETTDEKETYSGETHHNWKGGITPEVRKIRNSRKYAVWRAAVFEKDDFTCQDCGERGGKLEAHHIKPFSKFPELRLVVSNGKTLCVKCHKKLPNEGIPNGFQSIPIGEVLDTEENLSEGKRREDKRILERAAPQPIKIKQPRNPHIKDLMDFFYRGAKAIQHIEPPAPNFGKIGALLKKRLEVDKIDPDRIERMIIWYLTRKKKYKDNKGDWMEQFKYSPDFGVMLSDAFFSQMLPDEANALTYIRDNMDWVDKLYKRVAPNSKGMQDLRTLLANKFKME